MMEQKIIIEQYDNGITLQSEGRAIVVLDHEKEMSIGSMIWENVKCVMDTELCDEVEMSIEYKPIKNGVLQDNQQDSSRKAEY